MPKLTYLLGAGASYHSCPIWEEQHEMMIMLSQELLKIDFPAYNESEFPYNTTFEKSKNYDWGLRQRLAWNIGYFGTKGKEYGTIDTYARSLFLTQGSNSEELIALKVSVNIFFTIWQYSEGFSNKARKVEVNGKLVHSHYKEIDKRYIALLSSLIEPNEENGIIGYPKLNQDVNFISWNYDNQLEHAFLKFCSKDITLEHLSDNINYDPFYEYTELRVCHLNGFAGHYFVEGETTQKLDSGNNPFFKKELLASLSLAKCFDTICCKIEEEKDRKINYHGYINYAWDNSAFSKHTLDRACKIMSETEILVVIGYSFPSFNKTIDKQLFRHFNFNGEKIYYQSIKPNLQIIEELTGRKLSSGYAVPVPHTEQFIIPYEF